jgi:type I restriction enzyme S subunit
MIGKPVKLGMVADMLSGFSFASKDFLDGASDGVNLVRGDNVQQGFLRWGEKTKKWRSDAYDDLARYHLFKDDVILAMDRPIVGGGLKLAWVKEQDLPSLLVQRVTRIRGIPDKARTNYLRYALSTPNFIAHIDRITTGANIPHISGKDIASFEFILPSIDEQDRIVEVIAAYDDLIETNHCRITLLEKSARLLYREWFVNLRFPGHEQCKLIEGLPAGWSKVPLDNIAFIVMGQSPESKFYNHNGDGLPFHQGVTNFGDHFVTHKTFTTQATRIAEAGDVLCSVRAPVGRLNLTLDKIAIGRGLSAIRSRTGQQSLLLYQLKALFVEEDMIGGGAIFASVTKKELFAQQLLQPDLETAAEFNRLASAIDEQIKILVMQNRLLFEARDKLLPKLMSGEIQI